MPCPQLTEILHIGQNRESCCWTPSWQWWKASQTVTKVLDGNDWRMQQFELSAKTFKMWFSFYGGEMRKQRPTWWIESAMWFWRRVIHLRFLMNATSKGVATFRKWTNCCHPEVRRRSCGACHDQRLFMIVLWVMTVVGLKQQFKVGARLKGCRDTPGRWNIADECSAGGLKSIHARARVYMSFLFSDTQNPFDTFLIHRFFRSTSTMA